VKYEEIKEEMSLPQMEQGPDKMPQKGKEIDYTNQQFNTGME